MYGKMFRQMYHGTLATTGPWQALVTFQQLIVLADSEGTVDMTAEAISRETTVPLEIIRIGITALEQPDPDSRTPDAEGRRITRLADNRSWGWQITNYKHYRELKREEDRRAYHRRYWHERKGKNSTRSTATQQTQPNQPIAEAYTEAEGEKRAANAARASQLPEGFDLSAERRKVAEAEKVDPDRTFASFRDHWLAASGATSRKRDWDAAWRNWCRKEADWKKPARIEPARGSNIPEGRELDDLRRRAKAIGFDDWPQGMSTGGYRTLVERAERAAK